MGSENPPGVRNGNLLQYSRLENSTEEPVRLQSMGLQRIRHDWVTKQHCNYSQRFFWNKILIMPKQYITSHVSYSASQVALVVKNLPAHAGGIRDVGLIPGLGRTPKWGAWQLHSPGKNTGESHGQRSLVGYSPWGCKKSDTNEAA